MTKLSKLVLDKVESLGLKQAMVFFNRSDTALRTWKNRPDRIPVEAVEKVLADTPDITAVTPTPEKKEFIPVPENNEGMVWNNLELLNKRLTEVENYIRGGSGLPPRITEVQRSETVPHLPPVAPGQPVPSPAAVPPPVGSQPYVPSTGEAGAWLRPHTFARRGI